MNRLLASLAAPLALFGLMVGLALPASARTKKGDRLAAEGLEFEQARQFDKALEKYEQALESDTKDPQYQLLTRRVRFQAGQLHVDAGQRLRKDGKLEEALAEFNKAYTIDPGSTASEQELRQTLRMIDALKRRAERGEAPLTTEERGLTPAQQARHEADQREASLAGPPELKPVSTQPLDLKIANQPFKNLYDTVAKMAGLNVLYDSDMQPPPNNKFSLELKGSSIEEALDYLGLLTHTFWKPVSANTIFVTQENTTKRRDYEDHVTRVFYLTNITSPQELQEAMTAVRTVTNVRNIFPVNAQNALVIRGTTDQIALAEKIILDIDKPKSEVVVDIIVMDVNGDRARQLAATPAPGGLSMPINYTGGTSTTTGSGTSASTTNSVTLNQLSKTNLGSWSVTLPGGMLQAVLTDSRTRVMNSPQLRGIEGQKASLKIGERYPYASGSFQSGVGTTGGLPYAQTQFQFADVGVNVDITPRIHGADEVSLQIELEISDISQTINVGGVSQPVIGQKKVSHVVRLREGEMAIIGGLMSVTDTASKNGWPGLMNIPVIGRLFQSTSIERKNEDLLVVMIPHIVRAPELSLANVRGVATGIDQVWKVSYKHPETKSVAAVQPTSSEPALAQPAAAQNPQVMVPVAPAPVPTSEAPAPPAPPMAEPGAPAAPPTPPPAALLVASSSEVQTGGTFTVQINVANVKDLTAAPMRLKYDPALLKLVEAKQGPFLAADGVQVIFTQVPRRQPGETTVQIQRVAGATGVSGSGTLATLKFEALAPGAALITAVEFNMRDSKLQPIVAPAPRVEIQVR